VRAEGRDFMGIRFNNSILIGPRVRTNERSQYTFYYTQHDGHGGI
jgi:hypothetical protein